MPKMTKGFLALTITIILSIAFLLMVIIFIRPSLTAYSLLIAEGQNQGAKILAESCANLVLLKILTNANYQGNETLNLGEDQSCYIYNVGNWGSNSDFNKLIKIRANFKGIFSYLKIVFNLNLKKIISWQFEKKF